MDTCVHVSGLDYMIVDEVIDQRIEDAFREAKTPRLLIMVLKYFLCNAIGPRASKGRPAIFSISEFCQNFHRSERTIRKWLKELERAGFVSKRRGGPGKVELQLHSDFIYTGPLPEELKEYLEEQAESLA